MLKDGILAAARAYRREILVVAFLGASLLDSIGGRAAALLLLTVWGGAAGAYAVQQTHDQSIADSNALTSLLNDENTDGLTRAAVSSEVYALQEAPQGRAYIHLRANPRLANFLAHLPTADRRHLGPFLDRLQEAYAAVLTGRATPEAGVPLFMDIRTALQRELYALRAFATGRNIVSPTEDFADVSYQMLETLRRYCHDQHPFYTFPSIPTQAMDPLAPAQMVP